MRSMTILRPHREALRMTHHGEREREKKGEREGEKETKEC